MFKAFTLLAVAGYALAAPAQDLVKSLPQFDDISFGLYSGYLPIDGTQKQLHYMAALSQGNPATDPVILWLNGGPGCSSLLGFFQEHGPYVLEDGDLTFHKNAYSWNKEASVFYIESPANVGFSICPDWNECQWTDANTATDNLIAVINMFKKFPELAKNDFYISGESYAGIYVPYLSWQIDQYNVKTPESKINLKGFIVANGVTNWKYDAEVAYFDIAYWFGLVAQETYDDLKANCDLTFFRFNQDKLSVQCQDLVQDFYSQVGGINTYDLIGKCYVTPQQKHRKSHSHSSKDVKERMLASQEPTFFTADDYTRFNKRPTNVKKLKEIPPCVYALPVLQYLRVPENMEALHVNKAAAPWDLCAPVNYTSDINGSVWVYEDLKDKYKILKLSGDTDGAVGTLGTKQWINDLNWEVSSKWRPYSITGSQQVAGYVEKRSNDTFTFATVHGAGHMAAQWKRPETYHLVFSWIKDQAI